MIDIDRIVSDTSDKVTAAIESRFTDLIEAIIDDALARGVVEDATDYAVVWTRPGEGGPQGGLAALGGPLPKALCYSPGIGRKLTQAEIDELEARLPKGDRYDRRSNETLIVIRSSRTSGWTPWLVLADGLEGEEPTELVCGDPEGWAVWRLATPGQLRTEGRALGHCVGQAQMPYAQRVATGAALILSVRKGGKPKMTIEVVGSKIVQAQGKSGVGLSSLPEEARHLVEQAVGRT